MSEEEWKEERGSENKEKGDLNFVKWQKSPTSY